MQMVYNGLEKSNIGLTDVDTNTFPLREFSGYGNQVLSLSAAHIDPYTFLWSLLDGFFDGRHHIPFAQLKKIAQSILKVYQPGKTHQPGWILVI